MMAHNPLPATPAPVLGGQGAGAGSLASLDEACGWVGSIKKVTGKKSYTELALQLYRFLVSGADESGTWRDTIIRYGGVDPGRLDSFISQHSRLKTESMGRVIEACRRVYNTRLADAAEFVRIPRHLASKTVKEMIESGKAGSVVDFTWLYYRTLCNEIATIAISGLGIHEERVDRILYCLLGCPI